MQEIREELKKVIKDLYGLDDFDPELTPSPDNIDADYSSNAPLKLAKELHKSPMEIAEELQARMAQLGTFESICDNGSKLASEPRNDGRERSGEQNYPSSDIPTIKLSDKTLKDTWKVEKQEDGKFLVTGEKIEKFARRTDLNNYASVNRLRDIMKKLGIRAELTTQGAQPDSIISIAGKEFTLVEDW